MPHLTTIWMSKQQILADKIDMVKEQGDQMDQHEKIVQSRKSGC